MSSSSFVFTSIIVMGWFIQLFVSRKLMICPWPQGIKYISLEGSPGPVFGRVCVSKSLIGLWLRIDVKRTHCHVL